MSLDDREWLDVDACARRLRVTPNRVRELVQRGVLRAKPDGWGGILVEPAIVAGITT
ncbi:hypothetical protein NIIDNTM18_29740 [Mycolicibacterium litorale]|uniref:Helix-turn-helix domain-containing protein n=1 Tax=Mycolicibacterium litorale TaxID=758802 RepID=A0A6S6P6L1_9MYCO|nr:hypothetical protein [Mycolicibacterium litorale]BCI53696.1 hypothetical protein NIIDNTM18_29740 [Mycolicibacterium litorale]